MQQRFLFVYHALVDKVAGNSYCSGGGTLAVSGLKHIQPALFDGKFHILHVSVMLFQRLANVQELVVNVGHNFLHLRNGHGGANACNDVFALRVHKEFAHKAGFAGGGVTRKRNAGAAVVAHVAERHHLYVDGCAPAVRNVVVHSVNVGTGVVPASEHGFYCFEQLFLGIGGEVFSYFRLVLRLKLHCKFFKVVGGKVYVKRNALLFLHLVDEFFEVLLSHFHDDVGEHLYKSSVTVPSPSGVAGFFGENFNDIFVETEVENGVHHTRHGCSRSRSDGNQQRIFEIAEFFAGDLFHLFDVFNDLRLNFGIDLLSVFIILGASLGGNCKTLGNGKPDVGHLGKVCAFAAQQFTHLRVAFGKQINILVCHY